MKMKNYSFCENLPPRETNRNTVIQFEILSMFQLSDAVQAQNWLLEARTIEIESDCRDFEFLNDRKIHESRWKLVQPQKVLKKVFMFARICHHVKQTETHSDPV